MKSKLLNFFTLSLILSSVVTSAQVITQNSPILYGNEKGNGGDIDSISKYGLEKDLSRIKFELIEFLDNKRARDLFLDIDLNKTIELLSNESIFSVVEENLYDKYNSKKDALNFPKNLKVLLNYESLSEIMSSKAAYVLVLHEVFGIQGVEKYAPESPGAAYTESIKIWDYIALTNTYELSAKNQVKSEVSALKVCEIMERGSDYSSTQINVIDCISKDYGQFDSKAMNVCKEIVSKDTYNSTQKNAIRCIDTIRDKTYVDSYLDLCLKIAKKDSFSSTQDQAINCLKRIAN